MDQPTLVTALILGIVEGLTEFLPVSSTGHLIVAGSLAGYTGEQAKTFEIVIQAGAILAVCWEFRAKLASVLRGLFTDRAAQRFAVNLVVAFLPAGDARPRFRQGHQGAPVRTRAGGVRLHRRRLRHHLGRASAGGPTQYRAHRLDRRHALDRRAEGRHRAGIRVDPGDLALGSDHHRRDAVRPVARRGHRVLLLLAIPTLFAATAYSLWKDASLLAAQSLPAFGVGFAASFVSAFACVRWLIRYVAHHDFVPFAWYRIVFGAVILVTAYAGIVKWD